MGPFPHLFSFPTLIGLFTLIAPTPTPAILIDANITGVFTDAAFATPTSAVILDGDAYLDVNVGNGVIVSVDISNPTTDSVQAIFAALDVDPAQLAYLGGVYTSNILSDSCGAFCSTDLSSFGGPTLKSDDSTGFEILAAAFSASMPTTGPGPDLGAALLFFQVLNTDNPIPIGIDIANGNGILINGIAVSEANQGSHSALVQFDPSIIYGPEPSLSALLSSGLIGLVFIERIRRNRRRTVVSPPAQRLTPPGIDFSSLTSVIRISLVITLLLVAMPVFAQMDTDGDGILDPNDNCIEMPNVGQEDADQDGFGTVCDGDFNQDGYVLGLDVIFWYQNCFNQALFLVCDLSGPGLGGSAGALVALLGPLWNLEAGPSGWSCATNPPVDTSMGDPPCLVP